MTISVREMPPLRLAHSIAVPAGQTYRWAADEPLAKNVPSGERFSSVMPGGFDTSEATLPRKPGTDYGDLERLSTWTIRGAGGEIAHQSRIERSPRTSGSEHSVIPNGVGWMAHLTDDTTAAEVYRDIDMSHWEPMSLNRRVNLVAVPRRVTDFDLAADPTTFAPAINTHVEAPWAAASPPICDAWYDSGAAVAALGSIYYAWTRGLNVDNTDTNWTWNVRLTDDDVLTNSDTTGTLRAAGPGTGTLAATTSNRRFAVASLNYVTAAKTVNLNYDLLWTALAVYGNHGLTKQGTEPDAGFYASDVIANAISRWAPKLFYTTGAEGTIRPSGSFTIPHLEFREPTTAAEIITQANRFHLWDWAVWEGPMFYFQERENRGRNWRARVSPAELEETGPQVDRLWNGVLVQYKSVDGLIKTVGPPGIPANNTDSVLYDSDSDNPANELGIHRYAILSMDRVSTTAGATLVGQRFLAEARLLDSSGKAQLVGTVEDDRGVVRPAWQVRAGDTISFVDAADSSSRRIVRTDYDHDSRTCSIDLDAPPEGMSSLLERLGVVLVRLGLA